MEKLNKEWHLAHQFPHDLPEVEKDKWRMEHRKNCGCGSRRNKN